MGEANRRGTFEERKESAINQQRIKDAERKARPRKATVERQEVQIVSGPQPSRKATRMLAMLIGMGYGLGQSEWPAKPEEGDL